MDATSRKQLEDAARAAGYRPVGLTDDGTALLLEGVQQPWNPRDENQHSDCMGDALRLAVKLGLCVGKAVQAPQRFACPQETDDAFYEEENGDPEAATRRAIVRAAAAIGAAK